jgi:hypothetical protein
VEITGSAVLASFGIGPHAALAAQQLQRRTKAVAPRSTHADATPPRVRRGVDKGLGEMEARARRQRHYEFVAKNPTALASLSSHRNSGVGFSNVLTELAEAAAKLSESKHPSTAVSPVRVGMHRPSIVTPMQTPGKVEDAKPASPHREGRGATLHGYFESAVSAALMGEEKSDPPRHQLLELKPLPRPRSQGRSVYEGVSSHHSAGSEEGFPSEFLLPSARGPSISFGDRSLGGSEFLSREDTRRPASSGSMRQATAHRRLSMGLSSQEVAHPRFEDEFDRLKAVELSERGRALAASVTRNVQRSMLTGSDRPKSASGLLHRAARSVESTRAPPNRPTSSSAVSRPSRLKQMGSPLSVVIDWQESVEAVPIAEARPLSLGWAQLDEEHPKLPLPTPSANQTSFIAESTRRGPTAPAEDDPELPTAAMRPERGRRSSIGFLPQIEIQNMVESLQHDEPVVESGRSAVHESGVVRPFSLSKNRRFSNAMDMSKVEDRPPQPPMLPSPSHSVDPSTRSLEYFNWTQSSSSPSKQAVKQLRLAVQEHPTSARSLPASRLPTMGRSLDIRPTTIPKEFFRFKESPLPPSSSTELVSAVYDPVRRRWKSRVWPSDDIAPSRGELSSLLRWLLYMLVAIRARHSRRMLSRALDMANEAARNPTGEAAKRLLGRARRSSSLDRAKGRRSSVRGRRLSMGSMGVGGRRGSQSSQDSAIGRRGSITSQGSVPELHAAVAEASASLDSAGEALEGKNRHNAAADMSLRRAARLLLAIGSKKRALVGRMLKAEEAHVSSGDSKGIAERFHQLEQEHPPASGVADLAKHVTRTAKEEASHESVSVPAWCAEDALLSRLPSRLVTDVLGAASVRVTRDSTRLLDICWNEVLRRVDVTQPTRAALLRRLWGDGQVVRTRLLEEARKEESVFLRVLESVTEVRDMATDEQRDAESALEEIQGLARKYLLELRAVEQIAFPMGRTPEEAEEYRRRMEAEEKMRSVSTNRRRLARSRFESMTDEERAAAMKLRTPMIGSLFAVSAAGDMSPSKRRRKKDKGYSDSSDDDSEDDSDGDSEDDSEDDSESDQSGDSRGRSRPSSRKASSMSPKRRKKTNKGKTQRHREGVSADASSESYESSEHDGRRRSSRPSGTVSKSRGKASKSRGKASKSRVKASKSRVKASKTRGKASKSRGQSKGQEDESGGDSGSYTDESSYTESSSYEDDVDGSSEPRGRHRKPRRHHDSQSEEDSELSESEESGPRVRRSRPGRSPADAEDDSESESVDGGGSLRKQKRPSRKRASKVKHGGNPALGDEDEEEDVPDTDYDSEGLLGSGATTKRQRGKKKARGGGSHDPSEALEELMAEAGVPKQRRTKKNKRGGGSSTVMEEEDEEEEDGEEDDGEEELVDELDPMGRPTGKRVVRKKKSPKKSSRKGQAAQGEEGADDDDDDDEEEGEDATGATVASRKERKSGQSKKPEGGTPSKGAKKTKGPSKAARAAGIIKGRALSELSPAELREVAQLALEEVPWRTAEDLWAEVERLEGSIAGMQRQTEEVRSGAFMEKLAAKRDLILKGKFADAGVGMGWVQTPDEWAREDGLDVA